MSLQGRVAIATGSGIRMSEQIVLYVLSEDVTPADTWRLLSWCHSHGANEFTLALLGPSRLPANAWNHVDTTLAPFASGHAFRDTPGSDDQLQVALWRLTAEWISRARGHPHHPRRRARLARRARCRVSGRRPLVVGDRRDLARTMMERHLCRTRVVRCRT